MSSPKAFFPFFHVRDNVIIIRRLRPLPNRLSSAEVASAAWQQRRCVTPADSATAATDQKYHRVRNEPNRHFGGTSGPAALVQPRSAFTVVVRLL